MFKAIKFNALRRQRTSVLGVFFFAAVMVLLPISANAQRACAKIWDASGEWEISQGAGDVIRLNLKQSGSALSGTASREVRGGQRETGKVYGDADGDYFSVQIEWAGSAGELFNYRGKTLASGKAEGGVFLGSSKVSRDTWYSVQPLTCGWSPGRSRGNLTSRPSADAPVQTGQATGSLFKAPSLLASQSVFQTPYMPTGFVVLTWDAGPDHPNADVWVKYGRDRVLLMKQPKAGMQVVVQRGQMYTYVLMDGRNVLATATFVAQ